MERTIPVLSQGEIQTLQRLVDQTRNTPVNGGITSGIGGLIGGTKQASPAETHGGSTPDVHVAWSGDSGIDEMVDTFPGSAELDIYKVVKDDQTYELVEAGFQKVVLNLYPYPVPSDSWVICVREKFGQYLVDTVIPNEACTAGITLVETKYLCEASPGTGTGTIDEASFLNQYNRSVTISMSSPGCLTKTEGEWTFSATVSCCDPSCIPEPEPEPEPEVGTGTDTPSGELLSSDDFPWVVSVGDVVSGSGEELILPLPPYYESGDYLLCVLLRDTITDSPDAAADGWDRPVGLPFPDDNNQVDFRNDTEPAGGFAYFAYYYGKFAGTPPDGATVTWSIPGATNTMGVILSVRNYTSATISETGGTSYTTNRTTAATLENDFGGASVVYHSLTIYVWTNFEAAIMTVPDLVTLVSETGPQYGLLIATNEIWPGDPNGGAYQPITAAGTVTKWISLATTFHTGV